MKKRDAIIIAILVNAGLLVILLVSAIATNRSPAKVGEEAATTLSKEMSVESTPACAVENVDEALAKEDKAVQEAVEHNLPAVAMEEEAVTAPATQKETCEIVVKRGDSLDKIAKAHHISVARLKEVNHLKSNFLKPGQKLNIDRSKAKVASKASGIYIVRVGDNPWTIAMKNHMKVKDLLKLNNLNETQARRLKPGDQLKVR